MQAGLRQACLLAVIAVTLVVVLAGAALAQPGSSNLGTWKLNLAESTLAAGTAPRSATFTIEAAGAGIKVTSDSVTADGTARHSEVTANYDGKDNPITGTNLTNDALALTRVDPNTTRIVYKKGGKVTVTMTSVVSSDGNTVTFRSEGTNAEGQTVNAVAVYEKQSSIPTNVGTWTLNLAKSTYAPGTAPRSATFTNVAAGAGVRTTSDSVAADGTARHSEYTVVYDGKDNPISGNSLNGDVAAGTRIDANTVNFIYKKDGKVTITQTGVVSGDGKTYTITARGTNTLGQTIDTVAVYDRQ